MLRPRALIVILFLMACMEGFDASLQRIEGTKKGYDLLEGKYLDLRFKSPHT